MARQFLDRRYSLQFFQYRIDKVARVVTMKTTPDDLSRAMVGFLSSTLGDVYIMCG